MIRKLLRSKTVMMLIITIIVAVIFNFINSGFLTASNLTNLMISMSLTGTLCIGMTLLLISGEVDLATGGEAAIGGIVIALLLKANLAWPIALIIAILAGVVMGLINAFFVNTVKLMAFITTIAMSSVYSGLARILTSSQNIAIDQKYEQFYYLGSGTIGIFPIPFIVMVVMMVIYGFILSRSNFGRSVYMTGGNRAAARLCGINRSRITTILFINNSAIAAFAGAVLAARMHNASPIAAQSGATDAITAAVLGGVSFAGGVGTIGGCFVGIILMTVFNSGLTASGLYSYWQIVVQGLLLIAALTVDYFNERSRVKALEVAN